MNGNEAIVFQILKELLNSFQTSGNGFWDNKHFSIYKFWIKINVIMEKYWRKQNNEVIRNISSLIFIIWVNS